MGDPVDDKRASMQKKRRSLISRSPTPVSIEPREETPPPKPTRIADPVMDSFVGLPGLIGDATDAPEPAALGRREPSPPPPPARPAPSAPRQPAREALPDDGPDRTLPPERFPQAPLAPDFRARPVVEAGWTAPPPPSRPGVTRPGSSPTVVVAAILTAAVVLAALLVAGAFGGAMRADPSPPRLAPGTAASAPVEPAPVVEPPPEPAPAPPPVNVAPSAPLPPPAPGPTTVIQDRRSKVRLGKKKDAEP